MGGCECLRANPSRVPEEQNSVTNAILLPAQGPQSLLKNERALRPYVLMVPSHLYFILTDLAYQTTYFN